MKRWLNLFVLAACLIALGACGGGGDNGGGEEAADDGGGEAPVEFPVAEADQATIGGAVNFDGTAPENAPIDMEGEPDCLAKYDNGPTSQTVLVNDNGTLRNVFVYVKEGLDASLAFPVPDEPPVLDQSGCMYEPHVMGVQTGQEFVILNSDPVLHNIHPAPEVNREFNISQPREGMETTRTFTREEVMIPVGCDVHGWMSAYVGVLSHPYFAVTGDDGAFTLDRLPAGTYTVAAWHEEYGEQTQEVTVEAGGSADVVFDFAAE